MAGALPTIVQVGSCRDPLKIDQHLAGIPWPLRRLAAQAAPDELLQGPLTVGRRPGQSRIVALDHCIQGVECRVARERGLAREHLEGDGTEGEDIRGQCELLAPRLLGGHVGRRAEQSPVDRGPAPFGLPGEHDRLHQAEVEQLRLSPGVDHDIGRLEISVRQPQRVGRRQPVRNLSEQTQCLGLTRWAAGESFGQGDSLNPFHGQKPRPIVLAHFVQCDDPGVAQAHQGPGFVEEPACPIAVIVVVVRQQLDGHGAVRPGIVRQIHRRHPALADEALDDESADGRSRKHVTTAHSRNQV